MSKDLEHHGLQEQLRSRAPRPDTDTHELVVRVDDLLEVGLPTDTISIIVHQVPEESIDEVYPVNTTEAILPGAPVVGIPITRMPRSGKRRGPAVPARLHVAGAGYVPAVTTQRMSVGERRLAFFTLALGAAIASWAVGTLSALGF